MTYQLTVDPDTNECHIIIRTNEDGSKTYIPTDPANTSYQEYLDWVAAGNTPEAADPQPPE